MFGPQSRYRDHFDTLEAGGWLPRFNVAPSLEMPVIQQERDGTRRIVLARWGLIPHWCKDPASMQRPVNAKAETAASKPMFRDAFRRGRVLVPADAFYEWRQAPGGKQPYAVAMRDGAPFGMAGLLERWQGPDGDVWSFAVLTTEANELVAPIHNRMPAIVAPEDYGRWLDPACADVAVLQKLLRPYPEELMRAYAVSKAVGNPANEGPELVEPLSGQD